MKLSKGFNPLENLIKSLLIKIFLKGKKLFLTLKKSQNFLTGFTIVELIVVMAIFLIVVGTGIGVFISIVQYQRRILAEQDLLSQASYLAEYMSKAIRMAKKDTTGDCLGLDNIGYVYLLTRPDASSDSYRGIKFINQSDNDACHEFYLDNSDISNPVLKEVKNYIPGEDNIDVALTSTKLKINSVRFGINGRNGSISSGVDGASEEDGVQPRVTIYLDIKVQGDSEQPIKKIQTTVSQRDLNER